MTTTDVSVFLMATGLPGVEGRSVEVEREIERQEKGFSLDWNQTGGKKVSKSEVTLIDETMQ